MRKATCRTCRFLVPWAGILLAVLCGGRCVAASPEGQATAYNARAYGAAGDGVRLDTQAIQGAIDACADAGGGTVWVPAGRYLTGTLRLKSRVDLHLDSGAVLLGSTNLDDYPSISGEYRSYTDKYTVKSLIYAENAEGIALTGKGAIDGQGAAFAGEYKVRPYLIRLVRCQDVTMRDVTLRNGAMWTVHFLACDAVHANGVIIRSRCNKNNDGFDIDSCRNVRISDCDISSGDDAIVLKSTSPRPCENVAISNCVLSTACNALKMGTESNGGFHQVAISNCVIYDTEIAGIALEMVDGGTMEGIAISNISMRNVNGPLFVRLGNRARPHQPDAPKPGMGRMRDITITNIEATGANAIGCSITGLPDHPVENVRLENIRLRFEGGGTSDQVFCEVPEQEEKYPEYKMFGTLPAYGLYCRHVRNISLSGIDLKTEAPDERPALVIDDAEVLQVERFSGTVCFRQPALLWLKDVRGGFVRACQPGEDPEVFVRIEGAATKRIAVVNNDLRGAKQAADIRPGVPGDEVLIGP